MEAEQIVIPRHITTEFIRSHRNYIFVYGTDLRGRGIFGQAAACYGQPNCFAIPTKHKCCMDSSAFFTDKQFEVMTKWHIDKAIDAIPVSKDRPVILFPKIGHGRAWMPQKAPKTLAYIMERLEKIAYKNIKIV